MVKYFAALLLCTFSTAFYPKAPFAAHAINPAQFKFDKTTHDFGQVEQGVIGCTFMVYNTGHQPLLVSKVNSSCGCLVFSWPKDPVMPGDSAVFEARMITQGRMGSFHKTGAVYFSSPDTVVMLHLKGNVLEKEAIQAPLPSQK